MLNMKRKHFLKSFLGLFAIPAIAPAVKAEKPVGEASARLDDRNWIRWERFGKERRLVCYHYYIAAVWITGGFIAHSPDEHIEILHMITYPGERLEFDSRNGDIYDQAEKWLHDWNEKMGYNKYPPITVLRGTLK